MSEFNAVIFFFAGLVIGASIMGGIHFLLAKKTKQCSTSFFNEVQIERARDLEVVLERMKESFTAISYETLHKNSQQFLSVANETLKNQNIINEKTLESKKQLIDQTFENIGKEIVKINEVITQYEKDREQKFGELNQQLKNTAEQTAKLRDTAEHLKTILGNSRIRGQWGERMAEDVLRTVGLLEGINYKKQEYASSGSRPDYTFYLPNNQKVNMDVKFPLDNYLHFLEAEDPNLKESYKQQFLKDVKSRIKEVVGRDYINPNENTLDYVLVFIPNEQIYSFIQEVDGKIMDEALQNKVVLCSPLTLYAFLAVIRQAVENFHMEQDTSRILSLIGSFNKQWEAFCSSLDRMGRRLNDTQKEFAALVTTRRNQLEKPLQMIEDLRRQSGLPIEIMSTENPPDANLSEDEL